MRIRYLLKKSILPKDREIEFLSNIFMSLRTWILLFLVFVSSIPTFARDGNLWVNAAYRDTELAGSGTADDPYLITSAAELAGLAYLVNEYNGKSYNSTDKYYKMTANIDLEAHLWEPIGYWSSNSNQPLHYFNGHFDGDGHTISNMQVNGGERYVDGKKIDHGSGFDHYYKGLFGYMGGNGHKTIKNLTIKNGTIGISSETRESGLLLGCCNNGSIDIENVHIDGGYIGGLNRIGGFIGLAHMGNIRINIKWSTCSAEIDPYTTPPSGRGSDAGGIIGTIGSDSVNPAYVTLSWVIFSGKLGCYDNGNKSCGGLVGYHGAGQLHGNDKQPGVVNGTIVANFPHNMGIFVGLLQGCDTWRRTGDFYALSDYTVPRWGNACSGLEHGTLVGTTSNQTALNTTLSGIMNDPNKHKIENGRFTLVRYSNPQPYNFKATAEQGRIKLSWNITSGIGGLTPTSGYSIQTRKKGTTDWKDVSIDTSKGNLNYNLSETSKSVYVYFPELSETKVEYEFRIKRRSEAWNNAVSNYYPTASCALPIYSYPKNLSLSSNPNESTITLTWNMTVQEENAPTGNFIVQWRKGGGYDFPGGSSFTGNIPELIAGNLTYNSTETLKSITIPYPVEDDGVYEFHFRIRRADYLYSTHPVEARGLNLNTNIVSIPSISAEGSVKGIKIKWEQDNGRMKKDWYFRLYRKTVASPSFDYSSDFVTETKASELFFRELMDSLLTQTCTPYHYVVRIEDGAQGSAVVKSSSPVMRNNNAVKLPSSEGTIESLSVSKGYYNDRVDIKWKVTLPNSFTRYTVFRTEYNVQNAIAQNIYEFMPSSSQTTDYRYTDNTAIPGVYYTYEVVAWQDCNGTATEANKKSTIGFIQPFGVVSGKVTYEGGNAVQGVSIIAENDATSQYANRATIFDESQGTYIAVPYKEGQFSPSAFTVQFWLREGKEYGADGYGDHALFTAQYRYRLNVSEHTLDFFTWTKEGNELQFPFSYTPTSNQYAHISISYTASNGTGTAVLYVNGKRHETISKAYEGKTIGFKENIDENDQKIYLGKGRNFDSFLSGNMDEFRIWSAALDSTAIASNYDSYLSGKDANLMLYYRFDEPIVNEVFDMSGRNGVFNENHAVIANHLSGGSPPERTTANVPPCYNKAVSDANGNYLINTIPYTGEGSSVTLRPVLGVHEFNPGNKPLFFNQQSNTYNNVDFTDISSFKVSGHVYYEKSNYPVEGAMLKIDGTVANKDGKAILTDEYGRYEIRVPIGRHFISVDLQGHEFADGGCFPASDETLVEQPRHNFADSISGVNFYDKTKVRLVGRVVGGEIQRDKPLGFGLSKANIGKATVTLNNPKTGVSFAADTIASTLGDGRSTVTIIKEGDGTGTSVTIETDSITGEFLAVLPPIPFTVSNAETTEFGGIINSEQFSYTPRNLNINVNIRDTLSYQDTLGVTSTLQVNDSLIIVRYNEPALSVRQTDNPYGAFGDSLYVYKDDTMEKQDTIRLYAAYDGSVNYKFDYPFFSQQKAGYTWEISAYEVYSDTQKNDTVPLRGQSIQINNGLASYRAYLDSTGVYSQVQSDNNSILLDSLGIAKYSFKAGLPNIGGDYLLSAALTMLRNGYSYEWEHGNSAFQAYLLGQVPVEGSNFTTQGPDIVDIVLHDPPGSESYAFIEKGSTITQVITNMRTIEKSWKHTYTIHGTPEFESEAGTPFFSIVTKIQPIVDLSGIGVVGHTQEFGSIKTNTTTFEETISTSSSPEFIGPMADVYIGKGTNMIYGKVRDLQFYPVSQGQGSIGDDEYKLFPKEVYAAGQTFKTSFAYTQSHVLNNIIPALIQLRNELLEHVDAYPTDSTSVYRADKKPRYLTTKSMSDPDFGMPETYGLYQPKDAPDTLKIDMVSDYNTWITNWQSVIRKNEEDKVGLFNNRATMETSNEMLNRSFDAGVGIVNSLEVSINNVRVHNDTDISGSGTEDRFGVLFNSAGVEYKIEYTQNYQDLTGQETGQENNLKFGYELKENSEKDALSVDIYNPMTSKMQKALNNTVHYLSSFTFQTRAGQTSCPHEAVDSTLFYRDNDNKPTLLNYGTFKVENPKLYIDGKENSSAANIPSGREASYTIQMQNLSEANLPVTYKLSVNDNSNPDGLILSIDGTPLTSPRVYTIEYGEELTKVLKVRQSSADILDYSGITLSLGSTCDGSISSEASIEAHFIPSSTDSHLAALNTLVNINGSDTTATFVLSEYDRKFRNFADLQLQYKNIQSTEWTMAKTWCYYNDSTTLSDLNGDTIKSETIEYRYSMKDLADGAYDFRILSRTKLGNGYVSVPSNEVRVIKDVTAPKQFGAPLPAGGIFTSENEVSVTFNEDIQNGIITDDLTPFSNIVLRAEKNGSVIKHNAALKFSGGSPASTEANIALANQSFTIETYYKRTPGQAGTLLAHGHGFSLGFDASDKIVVEINGETFVSDDSAGEDTWYYITFSYNDEGQSFEVYTYCEAVDIKHTFGGNERVSLNTPYNETNRLYVGAKANKTDSFTGYVHELNLWNRTQASKADNHQSGTKAGNEQGLTGYWPLTEGHGTIATDKARSRHLLLPAPNMWYSPVDNYALQLDGASYARIDIRELGIQSDDDFAVEFWFYGGAQSNATLFSCGDGIMDYEPGKKLSVAFNSEGKLSLRSNGVESSLSGKNYLDNTWHHFALNVLRNGSITAYVDGEAVKQLPHTAIANMMGDTISLGARTFKDLTWIEKTDRYFTGYIDDLRIWRASLTANAIRQNIYNHLEGTENGLAAYYPFNEQVYLNESQSLIETKPSLNDFVSEGLIAAVLSKAEMLSTAQAPILKPLRLPQPVAHTITANNNKIILNITEAPSLIENCTLEISVKNILDLNGNKSKDIRWTAFVNQNRLNWSNDNIILTKEYLKESQFSVSVTNQSGQTENWVISNLPSWLRVSEAQGTLSPLSSKTLTFTVLESTPIGSFEETVYLTGSQLIDVPLGISLKVTGEKPNWSVNPADFENSMSLIARLSFEGKVSEDEEDLLAAFIDGLCVGLTSPRYFSLYDAHYIIMDIFGNNESTGKNVVFKAWDASTGEIYPLISSSKTINFLSNSLKGSMADPVALNGEAMSEQRLDLQKGWNWISINARPDDMSISNLFDQVKTKTNLLKGKASFTGASESGWFGDLKRVEIGKMYKMQLLETATLTIIGNKVNPQSEAISLSPDWNWIGYVPTFSLPLEDALADLMPEEGDVIKGKSQFAVYADNTWVGSLKTMAPGRGYLYQSYATTAKEFYYPSVALAGQSLRSFMHETDGLESQWTPVAENKYSGNMSLIAIVKDGETRLDNVEVGVFANEECRGAQMADEEGRLYISIAGSGEESTALTIKVYDASKALVTDVEKTLFYLEDAIIGSYSEPYVIQLSTGSALPDNLALNEIITIYPNPATVALYISRPWEVIDRLEVTDLSGRLILQENNFSGAFLNISGLTEGMYILKLTIGDKMTNLKFSKR